MLFFLNYSFITLIGFKDSLISFHFSPLFLLLFILPNIYLIVKICKPNEHLFHKVVSKSAQSETRILIKVKVKIFTQTKPIYFEIFKKLYKKFHHPQVLTQTQIK